MEIEKRHARLKTLFHHLGALHALGAAHSRSTAFHRARPAETFCLPVTAGRRARATSIGVPVWGSRIAGIFRWVIAARGTLYAASRLSAGRRDGRGLLHCPRAPELLARSQQRRACDPLLFRFSLLRFRRAGKNKSRSGADAVPGTRAVVN